MIMVVADIMKHIVSELLNDNGGGGYCGNWGDST
jgi:hypothetical protein